MAGSVTALARLGIGTSDPVDTALQFRDFDPGVRRELRDTNSTRGTFFKDGNRIRENRRVVAPRFSSEPTAPEWAVLLPWIMSGTPTGAGTLTFPWADTVASRNLHFKPIAGEEWFLGSVGINTATLRAASGEPLSVDLDMLGITHNDAHATLPALSYDQTLQPYILSDLSLTVGGIARKCREFSLVVNCGLDAGRYLNSLELTALQKLSASFVLTVDVPSGDNAALWKLGVSATAFVATFTNPQTSAVLTISAADVRFPGISPAHPFQGEGFLRIQAEACRVGAGQPLTITQNPGA
jgi:hypothetical protein